MKIRIHTRTALTGNEAAVLLDFLVGYGFAPQGGSCCCVGKPLASTPKNDRFSWDLSPDEDPDLEIGFLIRERKANEFLLNRLRQPLLLIGPEGVPETVDHICVPFEGKKFNARWLRTVLEEAVVRGWNIRLLHTDKGIVAHEIMRLAEWFRMDSVGETLKTWMTEDLEGAFQDFIGRHPETEVKAGIGKWRHIFEDENPRRTLIMGSLKSGYHLLHRHHGLNYAAILTRTSTSGYFIPSE